LNDVLSLAMQDKICLYYLDNMIFLGCTLIYYHSVACARPTLIGCWKP
jgi:hypothetical protein